MPFRSLLPDLKVIRAGVGSISKRAFHVKLSCCCAKASSGGAVAVDLFPVTTMDVPHQSCWATLPPELLRNVLQRVEAADSSWPARKDVVACSAVCKTWRAITKELVKTPEESGKLTFPISLKQPGPRERSMQCFIKRDKATSTFYLYLGLSPTTLMVENSKFLLAARKYRCASSMEYIISLNSDDMSRASNAYVGKLRSNFIGTKFRVYDTHAPHNGAVVSSSRSCRRIGSKQVCPKAPSGSYNVAHIAYQLNVLGSRGPRRMVCTLHSIPTSVMEVGGHAPTPVELCSSHDDPFSGMPSSKMHGIPLSSNCNSPKMASKTKDTHAPLVLKNKAPRWHEQLQCWCLNFRGRVTVASVKNFQLVAAIEPNNLAIPQSEQDRVLLQFGKIGKDIFTMDYRYPLSAYQAFAICLTSFGTKLACE